MKKSLLPAMLLVVGACWIACNNSTPDKPAADPAVLKPNCSTVAPMFSPDIPHEVEVNLPNGYSGLIPSDQVCFDYFSWRSFVALNWPAGADGQPLKCNFTDYPDTPRVWEYYTDPGELFGTGEHLLAFSGPIKKIPGLKGLRMVSKMSTEFKDTVAGSIKQATGQPLLDKNLNYVLFEIMLNPDETKYIRDSGLTTVQGQQGKTIKFPEGHYDKGQNGGAVGAIEVKATWKILVPGKDDSTKFYRRRAVIYVPAKNSTTGKALYLTETVGLVAMHILHKTKNFPMWIWTTFEHNNNAPDSAAVAKAGNQYSFYNPACPASFVNTPPDTPYLWQPFKPYAKSVANDGQYGTQVVQQLPIYDFTQTLNKAWQTALKGSVWANYRLIGSQWGVIQGDNPTHGADTVGVPQYMSNPVVETYYQQSSCLTSCHIFAKDAAGMNADFSFMLQRAKNNAVPKK